MGATVVIDGLDEFRTALGTLPEDLTAAAVQAVVNAGNDATAALVAAYPLGNDELRSKVRAPVVVVNRFGVQSTVVSGSKFALPWEHGTQVRHTQRGFNRGAEPAHPDKGLTTIAPKRRAQMNAELVDLIIEAGARLGLDVEVTGV
jgi:hypothetical protein